MQIRNNLINERESSAFHFTQQDLGNEFWITKKIGENETRKLELI